ncbi:MULTISPECIES: hypothetical protein [unclassified Halomonas]|uniref:hypothetical protein n=1 Tax=Halomonas sp. N3-2A TaxID=2014541 RepID=UPI0012FD0987|nr:MULTISPECIES: hypothetical protein [unclassified Halomonas]UTD53785.1 hypothetical protein NF683_11435 [Halomonas sp. MS1]
MMKSQLQVVQRFLPDWGVTYGPAGDGPFPAIMPEGAPDASAVHSASDVVCGLLTACY